MKELSELTSLLDANNIKTARIDTLAIFEHVLKVSRVQILAGDIKLTDKQKRTIDELAKKRISGAPLAYLLNIKEFYGRKFYVDSNTLIPRPESEDMIELALSLKLSSTTAVVDMGAGSGILGLTYALEKMSQPDFTLDKLVLVDISTQALGVASRNAKKYRLSPKYCQSDLFENKEIHTYTDGLMFANLPYVPDGHVTSKEITEEPSQALFSGIDGLTQYTEFFEQISELSSKPMHIISECLEPQFEAINTLAKQAGYKLFSRAGLARCYTNISLLSLGAHTQANGK